MRDPVYTAYMDDASRSAILSTVTAEGASIKRLVSYLQVTFKSGWRHPQSLTALGCAYPPDVQRISNGGNLHRLGGMEGGLRMDGCVATEWPQLLLTLLIFGLQCQRTLLEDIPDSWPTNREPITPVVKCTKHKWHVVDAA